MLQKLPVLHWIVKLWGEKNQKTNKQKPHQNKPPQKTHQKPKRPSLFIYGLTKKPHRINVLGLKGDFLISLDQAIDRQTSQSKGNLKTPLGNIKLK